MERRSMIRIVWGHLRRLAAKGPRSTHSINVLQRHPDSMIQRLGTWLDAARRGDWDVESRRIFDRIEAMRRDYSDGGLGRASAAHQAGIDTSQLAWVASKKPRWAKALYAITKAVRPARTLEFGTCIGVSTAYIASALDGNGKVVTMEFKRPLVLDARSNLESTGDSDRVDIREGRFEELLPAALAESHYDLVFKDGAHTQAATLDLFRNVADNASHDMVWVFDDITWSTGMANAWAQIRSHPKVAISVDLFNMGVAVLKTTDGVPQHLRIAL